MTDAVAIDDGMKYRLVKDVDPLLFRAYDIRGQVDQSFTADVVYSIGCAIGVAALAQGESTVVVARDGRLSGPTLLAALVAGLRGVGVDVIDLDMAPTPVLYYATHHVNGMRCAHDSNWIPGSANLCEIAPPEDDGHEGLSHYSRALFRHSRALFRRFRSLFRHSRAGGNPVDNARSAPLSAGSGVMLTGSHNPSNYNGLKIVLAGKTLSGEAITDLYRWLAKGEAVAALRDRRGGYARNDALIKQYQSEVIVQCVLQKPLKVVLDCGNGVTGMMAKALFMGLGAKVTVLYDKVDGTFPNHHPDPTRPENLKDLMAQIKAQGADVGLAFDGDGDRLGVVSASGGIIWADRQMMLFARDVLSRHPGGTIIYDVKCTQHLARVIEEAGGQPLMSKTGHSLVKAKLAETGALLAGEMSGHVFFQEDWYGFDDGMYAGARLLQLLSRCDLPCDRIFADLPDSVNTPELHVPVADERKMALMAELAEKASFGDAEVITLDGLRVHFLRGWGLVRASNTTPCLVLRFEADDEAALADIQRCFREQLLAVDATLQLPF